jgi:hypothetical protein
VRSPRKGGKGSSRKAMQGRQMSGMEGVNKLLRVSKVSSWFPAIVTRVIALPLDKVLVLVMILTTIQDAFNFIFKLVFDLDWLRRWWHMTIDFIAKPGRETINMEDGMLVHGWWEEESIREVSSALRNFVGAKLSWG